MLQAHEPSGTTVRLWQLADAVHDSAPQLSVASRHALAASQCISHGPVPQLNVAVWHALF